MYLTPNIVNIPKIDIDSGIVTPKYFDNRYLWHGNEKDAEINC